MAAVLPITLYDILEEIHPHPAMYFGDASILQLRAFLCGFSWAEEKLGVRLSQETPSFRDFDNWVAMKFGWYESTPGWANIILQEYEGDEQEAGRAFFELFDDFRKGPPLTPEGRGPYGRRSWNTWEYAVIFDCSERPITATSPDLSGCVASGSTITEAAQNMKLAIEKHIETLFRAGKPIYPPSLLTRLVKVNGIEIHRRK